MWSIVSAVEFLSTHLHGLTIACTGIYSICTVTQVSVALQAVYSWFWHLNLIFQYKWQGQSHLKNYVKLQNFCAKPSPCNQQHTKHGLKLVFKAQFMQTSGWLCGWWNNNIHLSWFGGWWWDCGNESLAQKKHNKAKENEDKNKTWGQWVTSDSSEWADVRHKFYCCHSIYKLTSLRSVLICKVGVQ